MSLADMTITPAAAPSSKPAGPAATSFVRPNAGPTGTLVMKDGRFSAADGSDAAPIIKREGGAGAAPPKNASEILAKFGATWAQDQAAPGAKPAEAAPSASGEAAAAPPAAAAAEPGKEPPKPAEGSAAALVPDELRVLFGERKPAEIKAELDRYAEHNRRLVAEIETARKAPAAPADDAGAYIDDSVGDVRRRIARALGHEDPNHADVTAELQALTLELNAAVFGATLDDAQQAKRDAAKARQALARDTRARKAQGESQPSSEEAAAKQATAFIGNRLSATRTGSDGKALPALRDQFPLAAVMAQRPGAPPLEAQIYEIYRRELNTGRFDPARVNDDDYLISEAGKILESHYQDLAETLGKARTPSTATPPTPAPPAPAPSASDGPPQGHGGRTALTAADSSQAPPTPPTPPAPKPTTKKLMSKGEFFAKWYPEKS